MLIGYMRVSKADGSQVLDLQRDPLLDAGVDPNRLYQDLASGKKDDRPGLEACLKSLREGDTFLSWQETKDRPFLRRCYWNPCSSASVRASVVASDGLHPSTFSYHR